MPKCKRHFETLIYTILNNQVIQSRIISASCSGFDFDYYFMVEPFQHWVNPICQLLYGRALPTLSKSDMSAVPKSHFFFECFLSHTFIRGHNVTKIKIPKLTIFVISPKFHSSCTEPNKISVILYCQLYYMVYCDPMQYVSRSQRAYGKWPTKRPLPNKCLLSNKSPLYAAKIVLDAPI